MILRCPKHLAGLTWALVLATSLAAAWTPLSIEDDPLPRMPGTQPADGVSLENPNRCLNCHGGYDPAVEPGWNWAGSMMAQAARDPIFWATLVVAAQDAIWAVGNPNAVDLCERCHFPAGWLGGRSDPANASAMTGSDYDGVHCDFCHRSWDPFFADTHAGVREGDDWIGLWDEAGNTGPGSGTLSQDLADETLLEDGALAEGTRSFDGSAFHVDDRPVPPQWLEQASGQFFISPNAGKRASFSDAAARHSFLYSRYHKSKYFCGTCHDVSNPVLANLGLSGLADDGSGRLITEQYSAHAYFHVERTFSEFQASAYGRPGGAETNPGFQAQGGAGITRARSCQDCHLPDRVGQAADKNDAVLRPNDSTEHPASGLPLHDMTGGNAWMSWILASLDANGPVFDPVNLALLDQGAGVLTLDLDAGQSPKNNGAALKAGSDRAMAQLQMAASLEGLSYDPVTGWCAFRIVNHTGHKLPTGYPEGRRMFVNIRAYDAGGGLIQEINPYDDAVGTLKGLGASPAPGPGEQLLESLIYESHPSSSLTGEVHTHHFVLADGRSKDNRIPPKGFDPAIAADRMALPVDPSSHQVDPGFFTEAEYAGGHDDVQVGLVAGAADVVVSLYYQGTSREYVQFLREEINGTGTSLSSPTPSGEPEAYVVQTDPFFSQLRPWGEVIWELWWHNHGLDGSGVAIPGIVPALMTQASAVVAPPADLGLVKSDSSDPVDAGSAFDYALNITNGGPGDAAGLVVTDTLPPGVAFQSFGGAGWSCNEAGGTVSCSRAQLASGAATTLVLTVQAPLTEGTRVNQARVDAATLDPEPGNDADQEDTFIDNHPPMAVDDDAGVSEGGTLVVSAVDGLLSNDSDPENDALQVTATPLSPPEHGALVLAPDGGFSYGHDGSETVVDDFVYEVCDPTPACDTATVVLAVSPVNDPPSAVDDAGSTSEDEPFTTVNVLDNDDDPEGDPLTVSGLDLSSTSGLVTDLGDGRFDYDPNGQFESLGPGESGIDTFEYTLSDGNGGTDQATVAVTVTGVNDPPVAVDDSYDAVARVAMLGQVTENDHDAESHPLDVALEDNVANGDLELQPNGQFSYRSSGSHTGLDGFSYRIADGHGGSDVGQVQITVTNQPPVAADDHFSVDADGVLEASVAGNDHDGDGGLQGLVFSGPVSPPGHGSLTFESNGDFVYRPDPGYQGPDEFGYTASDGVASDAGQVFIDVIDTGGSSLHVNGERFVTDVDTPLQASVADNDWDSENRPLSFTLISGPAAGTLDFQPDGGFTYQPPAGARNIGVGFDYRVDNGLQTADATALIQVGIVILKTGFEDAE